MENMAYILTTNENYLNLDKLISNLNNYINNYFPL